MAPRYITQPVRRTLAEKLAAQKSLALRQAQASPVRGKLAAAFG